MNDTTSRLLAERLADADGWVFAALPDGEPDRSHKYHDGYGDPTKTLYREMAMTVLAAREEGRQSSTRGEGLDGLTSQPHVAKGPVALAITETVPSGWEALASEFTKSHFMTTTSGPGARPNTRRHTLEFTFVDEGDGDEGRARRDALHDAISRAAEAAQGEGEGQ